VRFVTIKMETREEDFEKFYICPECHQGECCGKLGYFIMNDIWGKCFSCYKKTESNSCPDCGSTGIQMEKTARWYICHNCHKRFSRAEMIDKPAS